MKKIRVNADAIINDAKDRDPVRVNATFRLDNALYDQFKKACEKEKVSYVAVLEALLRDFLKK